MDEQHPDKKISDELAALKEEIKALELANKKLSRELRVTNAFLEKTERTVTAKEAMGSALSAANAQQRAYTDMLLESCPNIILLLDNKGRFVMCTKKFLTSIAVPNFDYIKDKHYGEIFGRYLNSNMADKLHAGIQDAMKTHNAVTLNERIDFGETGASRYYSIELNIVEGSRAGDAGFDEGVLAVFNDLTDVVREKDRAEAANRAKSDFLASMSHEIRTPMNAILGMTELVLRNEADEKQKESLSDIQKASHSLLSIINDILDFSKIEAGKMEIASRDYDLLDAIDYTANLFRPLIEKKGLRFDVEVDANTPRFANGDDNRVVQILTNILSNAMKYTAEGFVALRAGLTDDQMLHFEVEDSGLGIKAEDAKRLFQPFEQFDMQKNRNVKGTGLGLSIAKRMCELMDGRMWLQSVYGEGSKFMFEVPYVAAKGEVAGAAEPQDVEFSAKGARILVVDDIKINLTVAEGMLEVFDIFPDSALSGAEALDLVYENTYDMIFMDQMMPEMDGVEATKRIRAMGGYRKNVPIIALTANVVNDAQAYLLHNGFTGFLGKPLELASLAGCLRTWLPEKCIKD